MAHLVSSRWLLGTAIALSLLGSLHAQAPANDSFAGRIEFAGSTNRLTASSNLAAREPGEPNHNGYDVGASIWWTWMAPDSGPVSIDTVGSSFDTTLAVYSGNALDRLTLVAENDDDGGAATSGLTFQAVAGMTYQIAVDGYNGATGDVVLNLKLPVTPTPPSFGEEPLDAIVLAGTITNVVFRIEATGTLPLRYDWTFNGLPLVGFHQPELIITNPVSAQGGVYRVLVSNSVGVRPSRDITLTVLTTLANDAFAQRAPLAGPHGTVSSQNRNATAENGDPAPAGNHGGRSVWWTWTAPANGLVRFTAEGSSFDTILGVYQGDSLGSLLAVAENDDANGARTSGLTFRATAGNAYQVLVDGFRAENGVIASGDIVLNWHQFPDNDAFAQRIPLEGRFAIVEDSTATATREDGEPSHGQNAAGQTVWWTWTAPASGPVHLVADSASPVLLAIYTGSTLAGLSQVIHDDTAQTNAQVRFQAVTGEQYQIALDAYAGFPPASRIVLRLAQSQTGNDDFANRVPLLGSTNVVNAENIGASREAGEPLHAANTGGASLWWSWIAPYSGPARVSTLGSSFDTVLAVYTGLDLATLSLVSANDDAGDQLQSALTFEAQEGVEYQIAVDGYGDETGVETGEIALTLSQVIPPRPGGNDMLANRFPLTGGTNSVSGSNRTATKEPGEPDHAGNRGGRSVWWSWVAPASDPVTVNTVGSSFDTLMGVYTGPDAAHLALVGSDDDSAGSGKSSLTFLPTAGVEYLIAVDGYLDGTDQAAGDVVLNLQQYPPGPQIANDDFANRTPFLAQIRTIIGSNIGATREAGEPAHLGSSSGASVWWSWVSPASGAVTIDTLGSAIDTILSIYTGTSLETLELVGENDDIGGGVNKSRVRFQALAGTEYFVAVEGYGGRIGAITLNVNQDPVSPEAPVITQQPRSHTRFLGGAGGGTNVTFRVVATGSLPMTYQWQHNGMDLADGTGPALTVTNVSVSDAGAYRVVVSNAQGSATSATVVLALVEAAFNDQFAQRISLTGTSNTVFGSILQGSKEPGEPNHAGNIGGRSVWWSWIAPSDGLVSIDTFGSSFDTGLSVYEGAAIESLTLVTENDDLLSGRNNNSFVRFNAVAGRQYQIAVDGFKTNGTHASVILNLRQPPEPPRLLTQPASQDLMAGATLTLEVVGAGVTPLYQYQWYIGSDAIPGATGSTLILPNATIQQRGRYHVVVNNEFGTIHSEPADVWVRLRQPVAQRLQTPMPLPNGRLQIAFSDPDGFSLPDPEAFEFQSAASPAPGAGGTWSSHPPGAVSLRDGKLVFEDPSPGASHRFYRVREK